MRKVNQCPDGGLSRLQVRLLNDETIQCSVCLEMLKEKKFERKEMTRVVEAMLDGTFTKSLLPRNEYQEEPCEEEENPIDANRTKVIAVTWLRTLEPTLTLLTPGTFNKRYPLRCKICVNRTWPQGKVLELSNLKLSTARHFVQQHVRSAQHQTALHERNNVTQVVRVACSGLHIDDHEQGNKLFQYRSEFRLWAQHTNFEGCAKHSYTQAPNQSGWIVRSFSCLREVDERPNFDYQVCTACLELGRSHGAAWY